MVSTRSAQVAVFWLIFTATFYLYLPHFVSFCCHLDEKACDIICHQICLGCFYGDSKWSTSFLIFFFFLYLSQLCHRGTCDRYDYHVSQTTDGTDKSFGLTPARPRSVLLSFLILRLIIQHQREATMSGKERSPRHRPWSVYRANTFDLSAEMMGLALSGN